MIVNEGIKAGKFELPAINQLKQGDYFGRDNFVYMFNSMFFFVSFIHLKL